MLNRLILSLMVGLIVLPVATLAPVESAQAPDDLITPQGNTGMEFGQVVDDEGTIRFTDEVAERIASTGATWVHINFRLGGFQDWTETETYGYSAISLYDEVIETAHRHDLEVVALLSNEAWHGGLNNWQANSFERDGGDGENTYLREFVDEAAVPLAQHFDGRIEYWEVWNEPNANITYLYPSNFAWLLAEVYTGVKESGVDSATFISGGLSTVQSALGMPTSYSTGADYLRETYTRGKELAGWESIREQYGSYPLDVIGQHIYVDGYRRTDQRTVQDALQYVRDAYVEGEGGDESKRTVITEMGWATSNVSERVQADNLQTAYGVLKNTPYLQTASWFFLQDNSDSSLTFGLLRDDDSEKLSWQGYQIINFPEVAPLQPYGVDAKGSSVQVHLEWHSSAAPDIAGYRIARSTDPEGPFTELTSDLLETPEFTDTDAELDTPYYYRVTAIDDLGNASEESTIAGSASVEIENLDPFDSTWARTDLPVASEAVSRTWMWGDGPFTSILTERYDDSEAGYRQVQYFDKSRMELTHPDAEEDEWYVTNGLLVFELMAGLAQISDSRYIEREPARINVAGDPGTGPSYADLSPLRWVAASEEGEPITARVNIEGDVSDDESLAEYEVESAYHVEETDHTVASVFWDFMTSEGVIVEDGEQTDGDLFQDPFYATGFPITEAYWTEVTVSGDPQDVLVQCFQRRCLTYTPGNEEGWQVEAGNVGQHYYQWRYRRPQG